MSSDGATDVDLIPLSVEIRGRDVLSRPVELGFARFKSACGEIQSQATNIAKIGWQKGKIIKKNIQMATNIAA